MHSASVRISAVTIKEEDAFCGDTKSVFDVKKCFEKTSSPETPGDSIESDQNDKSRLTEEFHHMAIEEDYADADEENSSKMENESTSIKKEKDDKEQWLPSATAEAMEAYENTLTNIYLGQATGKSITGEESMPCDCRYNPRTDDPDAACGDDNFCINRMMFMECTENDCSCERFCRNRRFQLRQYARVDVIKTEKKGYGLRALTNLPANAFVMEYIGEVITNSEFIRRTKVYETEGLSHYYFMTLKTDEIIDATKKGCLARFINHSCNPNCVTQKWVVGKVMRIGIFTRTPIKAGQELTFDYKFERYGAVAQKCYCGESNCKGYIGGVNEDQVEEETVEVPILPTDTDEDEHSITTTTTTSTTTTVTSNGLTTKKLKRKPGRPRNPRPLKNEDEVNDLVKNMLDSVGKMHLVNKLLHSLVLTSKDVLKKFVRLHGLRLLKLWLGEWKNHDDIIEKVLHVLQQLPLANRNGLDDCGMFDVVERFSLDQNNEEICYVSKSLLEDWSHLNRVYRIPKRAAAEPTLSEEDTTDGQSGVKRANEDVTEEPTTKRARFQSTREFFDPDDDFYEHVSTDADTMEIYWRMQYPPVPIIPTGPRAQQQQLYAPPSYPYYYGPRRSPEKRSYYNKHLDLTSTSSSMYNTSSSPISSSAPSVDMKNSMSQHHHHYHYPHHHSHLQHHSEQTYDTRIPTPNTTMTGTTTTTTSSTSLSTYDTTGISSSTTNIPTGPAADVAAAAASTEPKLPPNWRWATDNSGNVYYYNRLTGKTQWEMPEDKASSIEGVTRAELDGFVEKAMQDSEQKKKSSTPTNESRQPSSTTSSTTTTPTTVPADHHYHHHHHHSRRMVPNGDIASSSSGAASSSKRKALKEAELKQEVSKVVTKHLSSKKTLWKNDKTLFKELARKLTHHIVDRENNSSRKIHSMNDSLKIKIERFIDDHGTDFVLKLERKANATSNNNNRSRTQSTPASSPDAYQSRGSASPLQQPLNRSSPYQTYSSASSPKQQTSTASPVHYIRKQQHTSSALYSPTQAVEEGYSHHPTSSSSRNSSRRSTPDIASSLSSSARKYG
ncbi:hypothetical protein BDA99DRAFT_526274 [Phascolomyces articulosus]|uniref:SET domain-containing protein 2 n=1 Tax=Phascolomyces articulosus TaxID=60185 RepID=A0AAD5JP26_9FUNG|nr:hypothetical protein BDA99DRAFT_526274 [Phascolomyces articulosus]